MKEAQRRYIRSAKGRAKIKEHETARKRLMAGLKAKPCMDCDINYPPCVMDFDHRPGEIKRRNVGNLLTCSLEVIMAEIAKCDLVCANCHRIRTWKRQQETYVDLSD